MKKKSRITKVDNKKKLLILGTVVILTFVIALVAVSTTGYVSFFDRFTRPASIERFVRTMPTRSVESPNTVAIEVKANSCNEDSICETQSVIALDLKGQGNSYVCANSEGKLYRSTTPCITAVCGNGVKEGTEECDGTDLGGATCSDVFGPPIPGCYYIEPPICNADCTFPEVRPYSTICDQVC